MQVLNVANIFVTLFGIDDGKFTTFLQLSKVYAKYVAFAGIVVGTVNKL